MGCLLYTSDAADERSSVDLGGRRIIKKKTNRRYNGMCDVSKKSNESQNVRISKQTYTRRTVEVRQGT